jgi:hypothetical protein
VGRGGPGPGCPSSVTSPSQPVASGKVAVVITPPRGPRTSRFSGRRPAVSRTRVGRSGSMIGTVLRRRPLVSFVTRPPRPGYWEAAVVSQSDMLCFSSWSA